MSERIDKFVQTACAWEAIALKVGNVNRNRHFANTSLNDFLFAAEAIGPAFLEPLAVGATILRAVEASMQAVGQNVNLGIVLLLAPLARNQLDGFTIDDARNVYQAIRLANPGGLGNADKQDVRDEPTGTLKDVMALAADRDQIARQYANGFQDIFEFGVPVFEKEFRKWKTIEPAIIALQLHWLAREADSLIARKNGPERAEEVRCRAAKVLELGGLETAEGRRAGVEFDTYLRSDGNKLNPGTIADLIAATLFASLREGIVKQRDEFHYFPLLREWL